ncbi:MAG: recombination protein NinG [Prevotellaceae bacterium]|jgi:hypothetical protein|nr:recombination protein NinG [Prevotellaceae bacterium]
MKKQVKTIAYYKAKLDKVFSEYIRLRDADDNGHVRCISCNKFVTWKQADCGHYVNRQHMALRYDEKNCNAQCRYCNRFCEGNMIGYNEGLIKKYGSDVIEYLKIKKHNECRFTAVEYQLLINMYSNKVKELKQQKA